MNEERVEGRDIQFLFSLSLLHAPLLLLMELHGARGVSFVIDAIWGIISLGSQDPDGTCQTLPS